MFYGLFDIDFDKESLKKGVAIFKKMLAFLTEHSHKMPVHLRK